MRTTVTFAADVAHELAALQRERSQSFKTLINEVLRAGIATLRSRSPKSARAFSTPSFSVGAPKIASLDNIQEVLAMVEGDDYK